MQASEISLLERDSELTRIAAHLEEARGGRGGVVLIEGEPGVGKTTLLRHAAAAATDLGFTCLRARARELEREYAYGCVRQLFEPMIARAPDADRASLFAGAAALAQPLFAAADVGELSADASFATLHGLYWLLNNLADRTPVALLVDDLQWADAESLRFLDYLVPRLDGVAALVAACARPVTTTNDLLRLSTDAATVVLRPRTLSPAATATVCRARLGEDITPDLTTACWEATGGNPFLLEALLQEAADHAVGTDAAGAAQIRRMGPSSVAQAVLLRLAEPALAALVRAVAVLGDGARLAEAAALAGVPEDVAAEASDRLVALHVLSPGDVLGFAHPIVREAVYADIGGRQRAEAHARAARMLVELGASDERVAAQVVVAEPAGDADRVTLLRRVAAGALRRGAPATAVALLQRALDEPPPADDRTTVMLELAGAELRVGSPRAIDHLAEAVVQLHDPASHAGAARLLANALTWAGRSDEAVAALLAAIDVVAPSDREHALFLEADLAAHAQEASLDARARAAVRLTAYERLPGATPGERLVLAGLAFEQARVAGTEVEAADHLRRVFAGGSLLDEQLLDVPPTIYVLLVSLLATDALDVADAVLDRMLADARRVVSVPAIAFVLAHQALAAMQRGAVSRAEADARTALEMLVSNGIPLGSDLALALLVQALVEGDDVDGADALLVAHDRTGDINAGLPTSMLVEARGILRAAQGRHAEAIRDLREFGHRDEQWGGANPLASRWRSRVALALAASGDADEARSMALDDLARAERWGAPVGIGIAHRTCALVVDDDPADRLAQAVELLAGSPARLEHARALVDLGAALRRANRRRDARRYLEEGLELADRCGGRALAGRSRTELRAAGAPSAVGRAGGVQELTASERRVAELAADGLSNPEIAQLLFVTRKTVETHLGSVYRKLAVSGRGKLARALRE